LKKRSTTKCRRQIEVDRRRRTVVQETRLYDPCDKRDRYFPDAATSSMRSKEDAHDYAAISPTSCGPGPANAKLAANWVMGEVQAQCNRDDIALSAAPVAATQLASLLLRIADDTISGKIAKDLFVALWTNPQPGDDAVDRLIDDKGLRQISDRDALLGVIDQIIAANPKQVSDYRSGKDKLFGFFVGQAMKATGGKANPQQLNTILVERLSA
jgi:Asp-tRNA(Asn)/Glu-tRNA(Gln) amidotransferase B subunit